MTEILNTVASHWWNWIWPMFWQSSLLILAVGLADLLARRWTWPQVRYALYLLVLVKLLLPPSLSSPASLAGALFGERSIERLAPPPVVQIQPAGPQMAGPVPLDAPAFESQPAPLLPSPKPTPPPLSWQVFLMAVWFVGVVLLGSWVLLRFRAFRRDYLGAGARSGVQAACPTAFDGMLRATASQLRLRRLPAVVFSSRVQSPAVFGVWRPVLVMPLEYRDRPPEYGLKPALQTPPQEYRDRALNISVPSAPSVPSVPSAPPATAPAAPDAALRHILLHELAHIKRGDLHVHALFILLQILYWPHPLLWLVRRRLQHLRELCCDATVAGVLREETAGYRETLLQAGRQLLRPPVRDGLGLLGLMEQPGNLLERLRRLEKKIWRHSRLRFLAVAITVGVMFAAVLPMVKSQPKDSGPKEKNAAPEKTISPKETSGNFRLFVAGPGAGKPGVYETPKTNTTYQRLLELAGVDIKQASDKGYVIHLLGLYKQGQTSISEDLIQMYERWKKADKGKPGAWETAGDRVFSTDSGEGMEDSGIRILWVGPPQDMERMHKATRAFRTGLSPRKYGGEWPGQYDELMSLAEQAQKLGRWPGGESWLKDSKSEDAIRGLIQRLVQACARNDEATVRNSVREGKLPPRDMIREMRESQAAGAKPGEIRFITISGNRAMVVTEFFKIADKKYKDQQCLIYILERQGAEWRISDIDMESVETLVEEVQRFQEVQGPPSGQASLTSATVSPRFQFRWEADQPDKPGAERFELALDNGGKEEIYLEKKVLFAESDVLSASVEQDSFSSPDGKPGPERYLVFLQFNPDASKRFAEITGANRNRRLAIVFDGKVLSAPRIKSMIPNGKAVIQGQFSEQEAETICRALTGKDAKKASEKEKGTPDSRSGAGAEENATGQPVAPVSQPLRMVSSSQFPAAKEGTPRGWKPDGKAIESAEERRVLETYPVLALEQIEEKRRIRQEGGSFLLNLFDKKRSDLKARTKKAIRLRLWFEGPLFAGDLRAFAAAQLLDPATGHPPLWVIGGYSLGDQKTFKEFGNWRVETALLDSSQNIPDRVDVIVRYTGGAWTEAPEPIPAAFRGSLPSMPQFVLDRIVETEANSTSIHYTIQGQGQDPKNLGTKPASQEYGYEVDAISRDGRKIERQMQSATLGTGETNCILRVRASLKEIKSFQVRRRPCEWVAYRGVWIKPAEAQPASPDPPMAGSQPEAGEGKKENTESPVVTRGDSETTGSREGPAPSAMPPEPVLQWLEKAFSEKPVGNVTEVRLPNGMRAQTLVFVETRWGFKSAPQLPRPTDQEKRENAMALPEAERLKVMNKIENHVQVWFLPLSQYPGVDGSLKTALPPNTQSHTYYREMAFVGRGYGFSWFAYAPIPWWVFMQKDLDLEGGDDPLAAAVRGTLIKESQSYTVNSCQQILALAGVKALRYLEKAIADKLPSRRSILRNLGRPRSEEIARWLVRQADSRDPETAAGARDSLVWYPQKEAAGLYRRWLSEDAGKKEVLHLLDACRAIEMPGLAEFLPRVLESPANEFEYRRAFELKRELEGRPIPPDLLESEQVIESFGLGLSNDSNQKKVDDATERILASPDREAAAVIGMSLASFSTKGGTEPANQAGLRILRSLPDRQGAILASHLARSCRESGWKDSLEKIARELNAP